MQSCLVFLPSHRYFLNHHSGDEALLLASPASRLVECTSTHACRIQSVTLQGGAVIPCSAERLCPNFEGRQGACVTLSFPPSLYFHTLGAVRLRLQKQSARFSHQSWPARGMSSRSSNPQANRVSQQTSELWARTRGPTPPPAPRFTFRPSHTTHATPSRRLYRQACCARTLFANGLLYKDIPN